jgi:hypothetical protein
MGYDFRVNISSADIYRKNYFWYDWWRIG